MKRELNRVFGHIGNIYFNISIFFMLLCYIAPLIFVYDMFSAVGGAIMFILFGGLWICIALIGCVTFLIILDGYRSFLGQFGSFIFGIVEGNSQESILTIIGDIAHIYPILVGITVTAIVFYFLFKGISRGLSVSKGRTIAISVMTVFFVVSVGVSFYLIQRF